MRIAITQFCGLIRVAYDVGEFQVVRIPQNQGIGDVNFFAVDAVADRADPPSMDDVRSMMRTLLAERFQLQVSREPVEMPVYLLVAAEGGPKQTTCSDPKASSVYAPGRIVSCAPPLPMARVAQFLSRETGRYVMDKTGLAPSSFELHWQPETAPPIADSLPSLFTAIREQLGLKLEAQRAAVESVVVNHAERPSPN